MPTPSDRQAKTPFFVPEISELDAAFLSKRGLQKVSEIFRKFGDLESEISEADVNSVNFSFLNEQWENFDSIYSNIYAISLLRRKVKGLDLGLYVNVFDGSFNSFLNRGPDDSVVRVDYLIDMELEGNNKFYLIDEYAVRTIMLFRKIFSNVISYENVVTYFDVGCAALSVCTRIPNSIKLGKIYGIPEAKNAGEEIVRRKLSEPSWNDVKNRFHVIDESIVSMAP